MAVGDPTLTYHGIHDISGASLKTAVDAIAFAVNSSRSGASLHFLPAGNGQVSLISVKTEGW